VLSEPLLIGSGECRAGIGINRSPQSSNRTMPRWASGVGRACVLNESLPMQGRDHRPNALSEVLRITVSVSSNPNLKRLTVGKSSEPISPDASKGAIHRDTLRSERHDGQFAASQSRTPVVGSPVSACHRRRPPIGTGRGMRPASASRLTVRVEHDNSFATAKTSSNAAVSIRLIPSL